MFHMARMPPLLRKNPWTRTVLIVLLPHKAHCPRPPSDSRLLSCSHSPPVLFVQTPQHMHQMINWSLVLKGSLLLAHTFVLYLFPFTFFISAYWFVFFKMQASALTWVEPGGSTRAWENAKGSIIILDYETGKERPRSCDVSHFGIGYQSCLQHATWDDNAKTGVGKLVPAGRESAVCDYVPCR